MDSEPDFTRSSGNVFADLNVADPDEALAKAGLALAISEIISRNGWTQERAAQALGIDQPKVSALTRGLLSGFSLERLLRLLNALDQNILITATPKPSSQRRASISVLTESLHHIAPS